MRLLPTVTAAALLLGTSASSTSLRAEPALTVIEARAGAGITSGGGQGMSVIRTSPLYLGVYASTAIAESPWTWLRGGVFLEAGDRSAVGGEVGVRVAHGAWVAGASGRALLAPYTLYGGDAQLGRRFAFGGTAIVPAVEVVTYIAGSDLPSGHVAAQGLLTLGVEIDAW